MALNLRCCPQQYRRDPQESGVCFVIVILIVTNRKQVSNHITSCIDDVAEELTLFLALIVVVFVVFE